MRDTTTTTTGHLHSCLAVCLCTLPAVPAGKVDRHISIWPLLGIHAHASLKARCLGHSSVKCGGGDGTWETRWSNGKLLRRCASPSAHFLCKSRPGPSPASKSSQTPRPTVHLSLHFWLIVIAGPDLIDSPTPTRTPPPSPPPLPPFHFPLNSFAGIF